MIGPNTSSMSVRQDLTASTTAIKKTDDNSATHHPSTKDFIILQGQDVSEAELKDLPMEGAASGQIMHVGACKNTKALLGMISNSCGENTHIIVRVHGWMEDDEDAAPGAHSISPFKKGANEDTDQFIEDIRNIKVKNNSGEETSYKGIIHISSCGAGTLEKMAHKLRKDGPIIIYAAESKIIGKSDAFIISKLIDLQGKCNALNNDYSSSEKKIPSAEEFLKEMQDGLGGVGYLCLIDTDQVITIKSVRLALPEEFSQAKLSDSSNEKIIELSQDTIIGFSNAIISNDKNSLTHLLQKREVSDNINGTFIPVLGTPIYADDVRILENCTLNKHRDVSMVKVALDYGCNPCLIDSKDETVLLKFCRSLLKETDSTETANIASMLAKRMREIDKGVSINHKDGNDLTALHYACEAHEVEVVRILLREGSFMSATEGEFFIKNPHGNQRINTINVYLFHSYMDAIKNYIDHALSANEQPLSIDLRGILGENLSDSSGNTWAMQFCEQYSAIYRYCVPDAKVIFEKHLGLVMSSADFSHQNTAGQSIVDCVIKSDSYAMAEAFLKELEHRLESEFRDQKDAAQSIKKELIHKLTTTPQAWGSYRNRVLFQKSFDENSNKNQDVFDALDNWLSSESITLDSTLEGILSSDLNEGHLNGWLSVPTMFFSNPIQEILESSNGIERFTHITQCIELICKNLDEVSSKLYETAISLKKTIRVKDDEIDDLTNFQSSAPISQRDQEKRENDAKLINLKSEMEALELQAKNVTADFDTIKSLRKKYSATVSSILLQFDRNGKNLVHHILFMENSSGHIESLKSLIKISRDPMRAFITNAIADWPLQENQPSLLREAVFGESGFNENAVLFIFEAETQKLDVIGDKNHIQKLFSVLLQKNKTEDEDLQRIKTLQEFCLNMQDNQRHSPELKTIAQNCIDFISASGRMHQNSL
jgi:hypothetical protein